MEHVFNNLGVAEQKRLVKGVQDTVVAMWTTTGNDFRRFNLENGANVLILLSRHGGSEIVEVMVQYQPDPAVEVWSTRTSFQSTQINRRGVFLEVADELSLEVSLSLRKYLKKETV